jgi:hypothetical protein
VTPNPTATGPGKAKAIAYAADIAMLLAELRAAYVADDGTIEFRTAMDIENKLHRLPEEVSWRAVAWQTTTQAPHPDEFRIWLSGVGPSVRITGQLDIDNEVSDPRLEWFECDDWTEAVPEDPAHAAAIGDFARMIWEANR